MPIDKQDRVAKTHSSSRGDEAPHRLRPLLRFLFCSHDLGRPSQRQEGRRADEKDNALAGARMLDLDIEVESISGEMSTSSKQYQVVELGSPQRSRRLDTVGRIDLDAVTSQDARAHIASALVRIDEENFLVIENRATKWWWLVHPTPPKLARFRSEGRSGRILVLGEMEVKENGKSPRAASQGFGVLRFGFRLRAGARRVRRLDIRITFGTPVARNCRRRECEGRPFQGRICMR
jgi:hypothetical protein